MALSDHEQQILNEIEEGLIDHDPTFAKQVDAGSIYRTALSNLRLPIIGLVVCFLFMVVALLINFWVSFASFLAAIFFALKVEKGVRLMGRTGLQDLNSAVRQRSTPEDSA